MDIQTNKGRLDRKTARRSDILQAARLVFVEKGYESASISDIAKKAKVADGSIYSYFANKKALLHSVLEDFVSKLTLEMENHIKHCATRVEALRYIISKQFQILITEPQLCLLFIREQHSSDRDPAKISAEVRQRYAAVLDRVIKDAINNGEIRGDIPPPVIRGIIFGSTEQLSLRTWTGKPQLDVTSATETLMQVLSRGILPVIESNSSIDTELNRLNSLVNRLETVARVTETESGK